MRNENDLRGGDGKGRALVKQGPGNAGSSMLPVLSVIIPAYNVQDYIVQAIQSALGQTLRELEVIVTDDGSTDSTRECVASVRDSRLKLLVQENAGLGAARNAGIRIARGKYIGFLDADDVWYPEKAETHLQVMEQDSSIGITYSFLAYVNALGEPTGQYRIARSKQPTILALVLRNDIIPSATIARKDALVQAGLFDEGLRSVEDHEMWVRILHKTSYSARLIPRVLTGYHERGDSLSMGGELYLRSAQSVMDRFEATIPGVTRRIRDRGLAGIYRIASRKALSAGDLELATRYMRGALKFCPTIFLRDLRAFGTFSLIVLGNLLPSRWERTLYNAARRVMRLFFRTFVRT